MSPGARSRAARVESEGYPRQRAVSCIQSDSKRSGLLRSLETRLTQWVGGEASSADTCLTQLERITIGIGVLHRERIRDNEGTGPSLAPSPFRAGPTRCFPRADHVPPRPPPPTGGKRARVSARPPLRRRQPSVGERSGGPIGQRARRTARRWSDAKAPGQRDASQERTTSLPVPPHWGGK